MSHFKDANGEADYDTVHVLLSDDGHIYYSEGEFGEITLECDLPQLKLEMDNAGS